MKEDYRIAKIYQELYDRNGIITHTAVDRWKVLYWDSLKAFVEEVDKMQIGGNSGRRQELVAVDESAVGKDYTKVNKPGFMKNKRPRRPNNHLLQKVKPGRTTWKKPAAKVSNYNKRRSATLRKRPSANVVRNPSKDKRLKSRWVWAAVEVGQKGGANKSHKDGTKRVAMVLLPSKADAPRGGPRGSVSLANVMRKHLITGSGVVADEWPGTPKSVRNAGSWMDGTVPDALAESNHGRPLQ